MLNNKTLYWSLMAATALVVAFAPLPFVAPAVTPIARTFRVEAGQYAYSPGELHVNPGDTLTIELVSTDVVHGLYVDDYGVSIEADPGQTASVTFIANRPGSFRFRCNVTCGAMHPFMIGRLTVGGNSAFYRGMGLALIGALGVMLSLKPNLEGGMAV
jgi:heme/copper-type cytochrome/quinol oxidase subunit 2